MKLNITKTDVNELTKKIAETDPLVQANIALAGIDCTDGETTMDWEERCAAFEGYNTYLLQRNAEATQIIAKAMCVFKEGYMANLCRSFLNRQTKGA
jgi:hypothetical protein